jgi:hypothetical protein
MLQLPILNLVCSQGARDAAFMAWLLLRQGAAFARRAMALAVRHVDECQELDSVRPRTTLPVWPPGLGPGGSGCGRDGGGDGVCGLRLG